MIEPFDDVLILTGPTASGKSELGVDVAERLGAEIISMDSMALYRGMDIATAKPGSALRQRVPHHLIDVLDPWKSASVAWWLDQAAACCREIQGRGKRVLIVGGTPLYLKALRFGIFDGPPADQEIRQRLEALAEREGPQTLHHRLTEVDPVMAARLHPNDLRRVVRALEVWELTDKPLSAWQTEWSEPAAQRPVKPGQILCLDLPRAEMYARIDARVCRMFDEGLVDEVDRLRSLPHPLSKEAVQALGCKEILAYLDGQATLEETRVRVQTRTRQFAKRQVTWFRHLPDCQSVSRELTFAAWGLTMEK